MIVYQSIHLRKGYPILILYIHAGVGRGLSKEGRLRPVVGRPEQGNRRGLAKQAVVSWARSDVPGRPVPGA